MLQMNVDGIEVDIIRKKMKSLRIVVYRATGRVRISAPLRLHDAVIKDFILTKLPWIKKHQARFAVQAQNYVPDTVEMLKYYRKQLVQQVPALLDKWQQIIGVQASSFRIRKMKTRWGSCNIRTKRISLNLSLAKKSVRCLEFIIVHELVHLLERNHNKRFYALMDCFMPEWRSCETELEGVVV